MPQLIMVCPMYIKDQFIQGIANNALQVDMLAKAGLLKTQEQNISHAKVFETAMQDQDKISSASDVSVLPTKAGPKHSPIDNGP